MYKLMQQQGPSFGKVSQFFLSMQHSFPRLARNQTLPNLPMYKQIMKICRGFGADCPRIVQVWSS